jgi:hypothetical protein
MRFLLGLLIALAALVVIVHVALDPIATHLTRKQLRELEGYRGDVAAVHVTLFSPGYTAWRLRVWEQPGGTRAEPLLYAERVHVGVSWRELLHGHIVASVRLDEPKISVIHRPSEKPAKPPAAVPDLSVQLARTISFRIDRVEIRRGEVLFRDLAEPAHPEMWLHGLALVAENLASRPGMAGGRATTVSAHGTLGKSGDVSMFVSADPLQSPLAFAGRVEVRGFRAEELYAFLAPKVKLQPTEGTADVFIEFVSRGGEITGGVKPVLKGIKVAPVEASLWKRFEAWAIDETIKLFSDRVPGREAVATVIPIKGRLTAPDLQLWPTILGVVRNAFVEGLASGFEHLPPETAPKKEGAVEQAKKALQKKEGPPKAQPESGGGNKP